MDVIFSEMRNSLLRSPPPVENGRRLSHSAPPPWHFLQLFWWHFANCAMSVMKIFLVSRVASDLPAVVGNWTLFLVTFSVKITVVPARYLAAAVTAAEWDLLCSPKCSEWSETEGRTRTSCPSPCVLSGKVLSASERQSPSPAASAVRMFWTCWDFDPYLTTGQCLFPSLTSIRSDTLHLTVSASLWVRSVAPLPPSSDGHCYPPVTCDLVIRCQTYKKKIAHSLLIWKAGSSWNLKSKLWMFGDRVPTGGCLSKGRKTNEIQLLINNLSFSSKRKKRFLFKIFILPHMPLLKVKECSEKNTYFSFYKNQWQSSEQCNNVRKRVKQEEGNKNLNRHLARSLPLK